MLIIVSALALCLLLVLGVVGYKAYVQRRENAMLSAIRRSIDKPAPRAVAALQALGYRVAVEEQLYGPPHTAKDYDILLLTNNGIVMDGTTD